MTAYPERAKHYKRMVEQYLDDILPVPDVPQKEIYEAMRYSLLSGGKRIRPVLCMEFCHVSGADAAYALPYAAAMEMIHTYSLIHDDLPCMDDDDYRRGRLTCHKVYGEANAVLAGDALLTAAFETASFRDEETDPALSLAAVRELAVAAGAAGMVGGQVIDLDERSRTPEELAHLHSLKTGALIRAACRIGVIAAGGSQAQLEAATEYASHIGLAFQILDDVLDVTGDPEKLGKKTGMDVEKTTFASLYGIAACRELIQTHTEQAIKALAVFLDSGILPDLAWFLAGRDY